MKISRSQPGFVVSSVVHAGLLLAAFVLFSDARKFDDAQEPMPVEIVTDAQLNQIMKGEKTAREVKTAPRVDKVSQTAEMKPHPPLAEANKDVPTPPPSLKRLPDPGEDDTVEPPAPSKPKAAAPEPEKAEPDEAEVVKPKPTTRPKPEKTAPEQPKAESRLKVDEVAKLLQQKKQDEKAERAEKPDHAGEPADKPVSATKPKSGDENAPKSKFDAASISNLLSREAPQRRAATGKELTHTASLGAPTGAAPKMSSSLQAKIDSYTVEHYRRCWVAALSMNALNYVPRVEFKLMRDGGLDGAPHLLNPSHNPVEMARGEQALAAVRRCSPMPIPAEFEPYYDYWRVTELDMKENM